MIRFILFVVLLGAGGAVGYQIYRVVRRRELLYRRIAKLERENLDQGSDDDQLWQ